MIDLHLHTTYSDGETSLKALLKIAESEKLSAISITDHDTVDAYYELENKDVRKIFNGKIVVGSEITAIALDVPIEILGYNLNYKIADKYIKKISYLEKEKFITERLIKKLEELNLKIKLTPEEYNGGDCFGVLYEKLVLKHKKFLDSVNENLCKNYSFFYRQGLNNKKCILAIKYDDFIMPAEEVIAIIRKSGGKAFLAHPAEYGENAEEILEYLKDKVDGIECYHPTADLEYRNKLINFCEKNGLLISGGSDFHGFKNKVNIQKVPNDLLIKILTKNK